MGQEGHSTLRGQNSMSKGPGVGGTPWTIEGAHTQPLPGQLGLPAVLSWPQRAFKAMESGVTDCGGSRSLAPVVSAPLVPHVYVTRLAPEGNVLARLWPRELVPGCPAGSAAGLLFPTNEGESFLLPLLTLQGSTRPGSAVAVWGAECAWQGRGAGSPGALAAGSDTEGAEGFRLLQEANGTASCTPSLLLFFCL